MYVVKTKALISCVVTTQLICAFVFLYTKSRFSHNAAAHMNPILRKTFWEDSKPACSATKLDRVFKLWI